MHAGRELGTWVAAIVTGILFGLAHTGSASSRYLVPLGFLGFLLCLVRWRTGSLYPCMALHSINNSLALSINQLHWSAAEIIVILVALIALAFRMLRLHLKQRQLLFGQLLKTHTESWKGQMGFCDPHFPTISL